MHKKEIQTKLKKLSENVHNPFSSYSVASIVKFKNGKYYYGVNVESSSFGATICAERNAIFSAISKGEKMGDLTEVHLLGFNEKSKNLFTTPCGVCRQIISEASFDDAKIYIYKYDTPEIQETSIKVLLPGSFQGRKIIGK